MNHEYTDAAVEQRESHEDESQDWDLLFVGLASDSRLLFSFLLILKAKEKKMAGKRDFVGKWPFWDGVGPKRQ